MKSLLLFMAIGMGLVSCQKTTADPNATPKAIEAPFDQDFTLHYRQQAFLTSAQQPELTLRVAELDCSFCPEGVTCFAPSMAWPSLDVTDAQGQTRRVKLPANRVREYTPAWLDTTSVVANGRRYLLTYAGWSVTRKLAVREMPHRADFALRFRVAKTNR
ncbi:hypothetical protein [Hymenobacter koreensis]|uniref:Lipoprotein n=1 Tax=Hymenobacter koreensis TaxID=1084523 RepID=A0ABP8J1B7_9BACT